MFENMLNEILSESKTYEELEEKIEYIKEIMSDVEDEMIDLNNWYED